MGNSADAKNFYWDSCVWIRLINKEPGYDDCEYVIERARAGEFQIWSSTLVLAEVVKTKIPGGWIQMAAINDVAFEDFVQQDFVTQVQLDRDVALKARRLLRAHSALKKPNDAIHVASALIYNVDELHTIDSTDLLPLNGKENGNDGTPLVIRVPPTRPPPEPESARLFE